MALLFLFYLFILIGFKYHRRVVGIEGIRAILNSKIMFHRNLSTYRRFIDLTKKTRERKKIHLDFYFQSVEQRRSENLFIIDLIGIAAFGKP